MVYVGKIAGFPYDGDVGKAVEAFAFLIAVEGFTGRCDVYTPVRAIGSEEGFTLRIMVDCDQAARDVEIPGSLDDVPTGLDFEGQVWALYARLEVKEILCEGDAARAAGALVCEEANRHFGAVDDVEGVNDVVEAEPGGG